MSYALTAELARALGLPKNTRKAVLTLEAGKLPVLEVETFVIAKRQSAAWFSVDAQALKAVRFKIRLHPFDCDGKA